MTRNGYKTDLHLCWSGKNSIRLKKEARESDGKWGMFQRVWGGRWEVGGIHSFEYIRHVCHLYA